MFRHLGLTLTTILVGALGLSGCSLFEKKYSAEEVAAETKEINLFFEKSFQGQLNRSPMWKTYLGIKEQYGDLDDYSDANAVREQAIVAAELAELKKFNFNKLDKDAQLSYKMFQYFGERKQRQFPFRHHGYPVNQQFGVQSELPAFMANNHRIDNLADAQAYISRLNQFDRVLTQVVAEMKLSEDKGIMPPQFVYPKVISDSQNVIAGQPFTKGKDSVLWADFKEKVKALKVSAKEKKALTAEAKQALLQSVKPGYSKLIAFLEQQQPKAPKEGAVTNLPNGEEYYDSLLNYHTSTDYNAEKIHQIGLQEVTRIHEEMKKIAQQVGFSGSLQDFFKFMNTDKRFRFADSKKGRQEYLKRATDIITNMENRLSQLFTVKPKARIKVKAVEPYREKSAGDAFYESPAVDGSRPGIFYVNLSNMASANIYELEALAYHEGIPGHHMQISIAQELEGVPMFRKHAWMTAYGEGWGLYAEMIPLEVGMYTDPYSNFGRLSMELWRACRLVVDTGLHVKKWPREKAIQYLIDNTPTDTESAAKSIERYLVMPGQATAYKVGMLKILELRQAAKQSLGDKFDIRQFHDEILKNGSMPLSILEDQIQAWVSKAKAAKAEETSI